MSVHMAVLIMVPNICLKSGCTQWVFPWMFPMDVLSACSRGCSQWMYSMPVPVDVPNGCTQCLFPWQGSPNDGERVHPRVRVWLPTHLQFKIFDFAHAAACEAQIGPNLPLSSRSRSLSLFLSRARAGSLLYSVQNLLQSVFCNLCNRYYHHSHGRLWRRHCRLLRASATSTTSGSTRTSWSFRKNNSRNSWLRRRKRKTVWSSCLWITTTAHIE